MKTNMQFVQNAIKETILLHAWGLFLTGHIQKIIRTKTFAHAKNADGKA